MLMAKQKAAPTAQVRVVLPSKLLIEPWDRWSKLPLELGRGCDSLSLSLRSLSLSHSLSRSLLLRGCDSPSMMAFSCQDMFLPRWGRNSLAPGATHGQCSTAEHRPRLWLRFTAFGLARFPSQSHSQRNSSSKDTD